MLLIKMISKRNFFGAICVLLLPFLLSAEVKKDVYVDVYHGIGEGGNRVEAISNALVEAVSQINGVTVSKQQIVEKSLIESDAGTSLNERFSAKLQTVTKGKVDAYTIEDVTEFDGKYRATVKVVKTTVKKAYVAPGISHDSRSKMAVYPLSSGKSAFDVLGKARNWSDISYKMTQSLVTQLTQTRRFAMLDRENDALLHAEKRVITSRDAHPDEILKMGNKLGADYILAATLTEFSVKPIREKIAVTGEEKFYLESASVIQYRIILVATGQVKWSSTVTYQTILNDNPAENEEILVSRIMDDVANKLSFEIINAIYPLRIVENQNGNVVVGQGGASVIVGDIFDVYSEGQKVKDQYTGESLGKMEHKVGEIQISRVDNKMSYAKIIGGNAPKDSILRKSIQSSEIVSRGEAKSDVIVDGGGGIKLR